MPSYQRGLTRAQALRQAERTLQQPRLTAHEVQLQALQLAAQIAVPDAERAVHRLAQLLYRADSLSREELQRAQIQALRAVRSALGKKEAAHA